MNTSTQKLPRFYPTKRRYIEKQVLDVSVPMRLLAYLYFRQAPIDTPTLARVGNIHPDHVAAYLGKEAKEVRPGVYVIGMVRVDKAAILINAVRYQP